MSEIVFTAAQLADELGGELVGDGDVELTGVGPLKEAGPYDVSFLSNPKYRDELAGTGAGAVIVGKRDQDCTGNLIVVDDPYAGFATAVTLFHPPKKHEPGIAPNAFVDPTALVDPTATIAPGAFVGPAATIGPRSVVHGCGYVGENVKIGADCVIYPNVTVREGCVLGDRVILQPGVVIGSDGFGYAPTAKGHLKIPQVGIVVIEDDVEVGSCTTVDRAALGETRIGRGTKIDNLVQIAHNVEVGQHCFIVAQSGIAGSAKIGNTVVIAAQSGVAGHITVGDGVKVGGKSGVGGDVEPGRVVSGIPAIDHRDWLRFQAMRSRLPELRKVIQDIEKRVGELERSARAGDAASTEENK